MVSSDNEWMSISDMMSGLMLIFMFISISFMIQIEEDKEKIADIAKRYYIDKEELNLALNREFQKDLEAWKAEITKDNIIVFYSPKVLFNSGKSKIKSNFKSILNDFFPRYIKILSSSRYKDEIDEIRIEGHTSNTWKRGLDKNLIYLRNMKLSQNRANNVLSFCYSINDRYIIDNREWLEKHFRANGMAFSKLKYLDENRSKIDLVKSRRVEFRVEMKSEEKIYKILKVSQE